MQCLSVFCLINTPTDIRYAGSWKSSIEGVRQMFALNFHTKGNHSKMAVFWDIDIEDLF